MSVVLNQVVPWGRSRREYELMFRLVANDLGKNILGCGDGPASFNAEWSAEGGRVTSIDPIYQFIGSEIRARFVAVEDALIEQVRATPNDWVWTYHRDADDLHRNRRRALVRFLEDYEHGRSAGRYLTASLPRLPFTSDSFDLALCSHLLFIYSDLLDREFHIRSVVELCRVAKEVRIFPLLTLDLRWSPHIDAVRKALEARGIDSAIETVRYELQRGGNQMLRVGRAYPGDGT